MAPPPRVVGVPVEVQEKDWIAQPATTGHKTVVGRNTICVMIGVLSYEEVPRWGAVGGPEGQATNVLTDVCGLASGPAAQR